MKRSSRSRACKAALLCSLALVGVCLSQESETDPIPMKELVNAAISSKISTTAAGELIVTQKVTINVPVAKVWSAYTTSEGWRGWVAPVAHVELKVGGEIRTNYNKNGTTNDESANELRIVNYVPEKLLTLQAKVSKNWPEVMKSQEKQMFNIILFEALGANRTRITSYGTGYRDTPASHKLLKFFVPANEKTFRSLIKYLEEGKSAY